MSLRGFVIYTSWQKRTKVYSIIDCSDLLSTISGTPLLKLWQNNYSDQEEEPWLGSYTYIIVIAFPIALARFPQEKDTKSLLLGYSKINAKDH